MKKYIGIDAGTRSSTICVINEAKEVIHVWQGSNIVSDHSLPQEIPLTVKNGA